MDGAKSGGGVRHFHCSEEFSALIDQTWGMIE